MVGIPPEDSCTPVIVGETYSSELIAINHCGSGVVIDDIATLSFAGVIQSAITKQNSTTFHKVFTWTPTASQLGYQVMCAMAVDRYRKLLENLKTMNFVWNLAKMRNLHNIVSISMFQPMKLPTVQAK